jgi:hypothetical protein
MLLRAGGELAAGDWHGECAVARSRRAGPCPRGFARRQDPDVRQLRYFGNPLVARTQRRRRRAALPRRRRQCVVLLRDGAAATGGEDARIAIWNPGERMPRTVLEGHQAPVVALAASGDGRLLASASWDHTARLWPVGGGAPRLFAGHSQNVNGIAFTPDGQAVVTAGYDATLRIWPLSGDDTPLIAVLPTPLNAVAIAPDGEIVTAGADGKIYVLSADRRQAHRYRGGKRAGRGDCAVGRREAHRGGERSRFDNGSRPRRPTDRTHADRSRYPSVVRGVLA